MTTAIILMAGIGSRMNANQNKMLLKINNKPLYDYAINLFKDKVNSIFLVVSKEDYDFFRQLNLPYKLIIGGATRQESVFNALKEVKTERVLIHDGARILTSEKIINECLQSESEAYFVAIKPISTIRYNKIENFKTLNRDNLLEVQTPQGGNTSLFLRSAKKALDEKRVVTDDISTLDSVDIEVIKGDEANIKITTPFDLKLASFILNGGN